MSVGAGLNKLVLKDPVLFVLLAGLIFFTSIVFPIYLYTDHREQRLARDGITVNGTVLSAQRACSGDECQSVEVSYEVEGREYRLQANTDPNDPRADVGLSVGQSVEVRYDPADPDRARLLTLGESEAGFFRFMTFFGLIFFAVPIAGVLIKRLLGRVFYPGEPM